MGQSRKTIFSALILCVLFSTAAKSQASSCDPVRLDRAGGTMAQIPVMDQANTKLCYAYVASQMVDAYRIGKFGASPDHLTSPLATAVYETQRTGDGELDLGKVTEAFAAIKERGSCSYKVVKDRFGKKSISKFLRSISDFFHKAQSTATLTEKRQLASDLQYYLASPFVFNSALNLDLIVKALQRNTFFESLTDIVNEVCSTHSIAIDEPIQHEIFFGRDAASPVARVARFEKIVNERLVDNRSQPLGINFCYEVVKKKNFTGVNDEGNADAKKCRKQHSAMIVGRRRTEQGQCQLLVRNTQGVGCQLYPNWDCENGQIWVDEDKLLKNVYELFYLR